MALPFRDGRPAPSARAKWASFGGAGTPGAMLRRTVNLRRAAAIGNIMFAAAIAAGYSPAMGTTIASEGSALLAGYGASVWALAASSLIASVLLLMDGRPDASASSVTAEPAVVQDLMCEPAHSTVDQPLRDESEPPFTGLLSSIEHDLRTPLNAIIGFSDLMQQELHGPLGSERYQSYAGHIRDSGFVLLGAIESTLALTQRLSRVETAVAVAHASASVGERSDTPTTSV